MILYPSLHIEKGQVARLTHSRAATRKIDIVHPDPVERAKAFEAQGFPWLNIVDLDAAFTKDTTNHSRVKEIIDAIKIPVQLSGGMRSMEIIEAWLKLGVKCVVITSAAEQNPDLVREAARSFPGQIAVKIDSIDGYVAKSGWTSVTTTKALDLALRVEDAGIAKLIYADINPDGALSDVDIETLVDLAFSLQIPVVAGSGIHTLNELAELKAHSTHGIEGVILGRCITNGNIDPTEAVALANAV